MRGTTCGFPSRSRFHFRILHLALQRRSALLDVCNHGGGCGFATNQLLL